jgi:hypothetical protein
MSRVLYVPCTDRAMHYVPYVHLILAYSRHLILEAVQKSCTFYSYVFFSVSSDTLISNTAPYSQKPSTYTRILSVNFKFQVTVLRTVFNFLPFRCIRFPYRKLRLRILHCFKK